MLVFIALVFAAFAATEVVSYLVHRFLFHGVLWRIHQTHHSHEHSHGVFELNDLFSLAATALSLGLLWVGRHDPMTSTAWPLGVGIAIYGVLYFILHDLYTHRRFLPFKTKNRVAQTVRRAHQRHHQSVDKVGQEPYGLFLFPYTKFNTPFRRQRKARSSEPSSKGSTYVDIEGRGDVANDE